MGAFSMEASQINYRGGDQKMSVEEALKKAGKGGVEYKTTEYDTNAKWIDGRKIFGKVFEFTGNNTVIETGLTNITPINLRGIATGQSGTSGNKKTFFIPIDKSNTGDPNAACSVIFYAADESSTYPANSIRVNGASALSGITGYVFLEYVKNPET